MTATDAVGRYATSPTLNTNSALFQSYFSDETQPYPAIHLTVDPELTAEGKGLSVKGYVCSLVGLNRKAENCVYLPVPVELKFAESERAGRMPLSLSSARGLDALSGPACYIPTELSFHPTSVGVRFVPQPTLHPHRPGAGVRPIRQRRHDLTRPRGRAILAGRYRAMVFDRQRGRRRRAARRARHADGCVSVEFGKKSGGTQWAIGAIAGATTSTAAHDCIGGGRGLCISCIGF